MTYHRAATTFAPMLAAAAALLAPASASAQGVPIFFDDFLADNAGVPAENFNAFFQWTVSGGSVDLVGGVGPGQPLAPPDNPFGRFVDLGGSTGDPGLFEIRIPFAYTPGSAFNLTFRYRSTTDGQLNTGSALFAGQAFTVSSNTAKFQEFSRTFTLDSPGLSTLAFQNLASDTDNSGLGIDRVVLSLAVPGGPGGPGGAIPEPATWAMLVLGFGVLGGAMRGRPRLLPPKTPSPSERWQPRGG